MKKFLDVGFVPTLLIASLCISLIFDPSPGFGPRHQLFAFFCILLACLSILFRFRPIALLAKLKVGQSEVLLAMASLLIFFAIFDFFLKLIMPPSYEQTKYGWSLSANVSKEAKVEDSRGHFRAVVAKYHAYGFKRWGEVDSVKKKLLIIGDSFTEMPWVSNGEEWYSIIEKEFGGIEVFVFGAGGYGSLQEFMILDDFFDRVHPDLILWQFCNNDYQNNLYELEILSYPYSNHAVRPFLENETIVYRLPLPLSSLRKYSFTADRLLALYDKVALHKVATNIDAFVKNRKQLEQSASNAEKQHRVQLSQKAFAVTNTIMEMVRKRVGKTPVYMFNACNALTEKEQRLCSANKFICIENVSEYINSKERQGDEVKLINNGHWNKRGNELAGKQLADYFRRNHILD